MTTSITTRAGKGSPLTHDEVDANFTNLQTTADAALPLAGGTLTGALTLPYVTLTHGTITAAQPTIDASVTWNNSGVTFTGWKFNVTDTASASGSLLADWQVGGASKFNVDKSGNIQIAGSYINLGGSTSSYPRVKASGNDVQVLTADDNDLTGFSAASVIVTGGGLASASLTRGSGVQLGSTNFVKWSSTTAYSGTGDVYLYRDAAANLAQRNGTNAQTFRVYGTYTDSSNYVRASLAATSTTVTLAAETAGTGADNIDVNINTAGSGVTYIGASGGNAMFKVAPVSTAIYFGELGVAWTVFIQRSGNRLSLAKDAKLTWTNTDGGADATQDTGLARNAAGVVEVNNGTVGTFSDIKVRNVLAAGGNGSYVQTPSMTVTNLPSAATAGAGARAFVTDATATTFLSTVAGGGSNKVPVVSDGTNWLIG